MRRALVSLVTFHPCCGWKISDQKKLPQNMSSSFASPLKFGVILLGIPWVSRNLDTFWLVKIRLTLMSWFRIRTVDGAKHSFWRQWAGPTLKRNWLRTTVGCFLKWWYPQIIHPFWGTFIFGNTQLRSWQKEVAHEWSSVMVGIFCT